MFNIQKNQFLFNFFAYSFFFFWNILHSSECVVYCCHDKWYGTILYTLLAASKPDWLTNRVSSAVRKQSTDLRFLYINKLTYLDYIFSIQKFYDDLIKIYEQKIGLKQ